MKLKSTEKLENGKVCLEIQVEKPEFADIIVSEDKRSCTIVPKAAGTTRVARTKARVKSIFFFSLYIYCGFARVWTLL